MVYVNNKKFACESCIKGHRSSSCHHTDRPLFEIKKKGRPVSQCNKCRELRQSKKVHSKCTCDTDNDRARQEQLVPLSLGSKSRRYIPIVPALPNGLKDALQNSKALSPADSRQRVDSLLNPCNCGSPWDCRCCETQSSGPTSSSSRDVTQESNGLQALADAASLRCCEDPAPSLSSNFNPPVAGPSVFPVTQAPRSRPPSPQDSSHKRSKQSSHRVLSHSTALSLPPIRMASPPPSTSLNTHAIPEFDMMPSMSEMTSLAGSGCTCGVQCSCPGCVQHRGSGHASRHHNDCSDGCGTCIDRSTNELSLLHGGGGWRAISTSSLSSSAFSSSSFTPVLDQFFARAAALPPPPVNRRIGLDPTDTSASYRALDPHQSTVTLPKLDCCGGSCLCPSGACSCRPSCGGSCLDDHIQPTRSVSPPTVAPINPPPRSCCAGKRAARAE